MNYFIYSTGKIYLLCIACDYTVWIACLYVPGTLTSSIYVKQNLEKYLFFNMIIAASLNILMNFVFIEAYGVLGACITTFLHI